MKNYLENILGKSRLIEYKDLTNYFTLKTPVKAEYYFEAQSFEDWLLVANLIKDKKLPVFILAGGSNCAILKDELSGLVVRNLYRKLDKIQDKGNNVFLKVSSGYLVSQLVKFTIEKGFAGFEYHLGLPGTVGGAVYMNSKWTNPNVYFGDNLYSARLIDKKGNIKEVDREYFNFSYGYSILQKSREILLDMIFKLATADAQVLNERAQASLSYRKDTQPQGMFNSGCFFKNISEIEKEKAGLPTKSAGYLIDKCGLKGRRTGGFMISEKHANFFINIGNGTVNDLKELVQLVKDSVKDKYGIYLKEEVVIIS
jgi:UDP-N-acetylmuramate dehydrogenase